MGLRERIRGRRSSTGRTRPAVRRFRPPRDAGTDGDEIGLVQPKFQVYKRFLYIDGSEVLNTLAALEGGAADEVIQQTSDERNLNAGLAIKEWAGVQIGAGKKSALQREVRLKRTGHSAVEAFLAELDQEGGMGFLRRRCSGAEWDRLEENMVLRVDAFLKVVHEGTRPRPRPRPGFFQQLFQQEPDEPAPERWIVALADGDCDPSRLVMRLEEEWLVAEPDELERGATVVAQIDRILGDGESAFFSADGSLDFGQSLGVLDDLSKWDGPLAFLRPLCIFK
ncbi:MAG TPA: hypothetical protein VIW19_03775 [Gaiellaceae bacterium]|jgi:hypothetical protein